MVSMRHILGIDRIIAIKARLRDNTRIRDEIAAGKRGKREQRLAQNLTLNRRDFMSLVVRGGALGSLVAVFASGVRNVRVESLPPGEIREIPASELTYAGDFPPFANFEDSRSGSSPLLLIERQWRTERSMDHLKGLIRDSDSLSLHAKSTAYTNTPEENQQQRVTSNVTLPDYAKYYCRVYNVPLLRLPAEEIQRVRVGGTRSQSQGISPSFLLNIQDGANDRLTKIYSFDGRTYGFIMSRMEGVLSFVSCFRDEMNMAAARLHQLHPEIHEDNYRLILYSNMVLELMALRFEDPWQDLHAAAYSNSDYADRFTETFRNVPVGIEQDGRLIDLPWWEEASRWKVPMEEQGFGPLQINLGLAREASRDHNRLHAFSSWLTAEDVADNKALLRTILDPRKAIFMRALIIDHIIRKIGKSVLANPQFASPQDVPPFIIDQASAREYLLINIVRTLMMYPEKGEGSKDLKDLVIAQYPTGADFFVIGEFFNIRPAFPNMVLHKTSLNSGRVILYDPYDN